MGSDRFTYNDTQLAGQIAILVKLPKAVNAAMTISHKAAANQAAIDAVMSK